MNKKFVVNIGRQLGSGGKEIGEKLAARLGIDFYDKELITLASKESGLCREFFEKADERASQGIIGGLFGMRFPFVGDGALPTQNCLSNDALFKVQSDVIRQLASEKSCLFVGRCADYILREHPRCANIFISASHEARVARLCVGYFIKDNIAVGARFTYNRTYLNMENFDLNLGEDFNINLSNLYYLQHKYEVSGLVRTYMPVGRSKIFGLFNEARLTYGYSTGKNSTGAGTEYDGTFEKSHHLQLGIAPGLTAFVTDWASVEVSVGVMGFNFKWQDQKTNQT